MMVAVRSNRFVILLIAFVLLFVASAVVNLQPGEQTASRGSVALSIVLSLLMLSAAYAVPARRSTRILMWTFAVLSVLAQAYNAIWPSDTARLVDHAFEITFLSILVVPIMRLLMTARVVSIDLLAASLCVYLILGLTWALAYSTVGILDPNAFSMPAGQVMAMYTDDPSGALYFSYVTLTTLGYGDITPVSESARSLAFMEAILGQIFLVVLVARLVGISVSHDVGKADEEDAPREPGV